MQKDSATLRKDILDVTSSAEQVAKAIANDAKWAWAKGVEARGGMDNAVKAVESRVTPFHRQLLITRLTELEKKYSTYFLTQELSAFLNLKPLVTNLELEVQRLIEAHPIMSRNISGSS